jgi:hypothetical protein
VRHTTAPVVPSSRATNCWGKPAPTMMSPSTTVGDDTFNPPRSVDHSGWPSARASANTVFPSVGTNTRPREIAGVPWTAAPRARCQIGLPLSAASTVTVPSSPVPTTTPSSTTGLASAPASRPGANDQVPSLKAAPDRSGEARPCAASNPIVGQSSARAEAGAARAAAAPIDTTLPRMTPAHAGRE